MSQSGSLDEELKIPLENTDHDKKDQKDPEVGNFINRVPRKKLTIAVTGVVVFVAIIAIAVTTYLCMSLPTTSK